MKRVLTTIMTGILVSSAFGQGSSPSLADTMQWLHASALEDSGEDYLLSRIEFNYDGCSVEITEYREKASPRFWKEDSFSLADIDPDSIHLLPVYKVDGTSSIWIRTTNYRDKVLYSDNTHVVAVPGSLTGFWTSDEYAARFVKALKHPTELCGGKPSAF